MLASFVDKTGRDSIDARFVEGARMPQMARVAARLSGDLCDLDLQSLCAADVASAAEMYHTCDNEHAESWWLQTLHQLSSISPESAADAV